MFIHYYKNVIIIYSDIIDEDQARRCFSLANQTDLDAPPPPVVLESTTENEFICRDRPSLYSFSCMAYALNMTWYFNNETVAAFNVFDAHDHVGDNIFRNYSYPASAPVYTIIAILTEQTLKSLNFGGYWSQLLTSTLIVQPFNGSQTEGISNFTVSCQARCEDENHTEVCQSRQINIAGWYRFLLVYHNQFISR